MSKLKTYIVFYCDYPRMREREFLIQSDAEAFALTVEGSVCELNFKPTHRTRKGFGGLLKAGVKCSIFQTGQREGDILILAETGTMYHGKRTELTPLQ